MKKTVFKLIFIFIVLVIGYKVVNYIFDQGYRQGFAKAFVVNDKVDELINKKEEADLVPQCSYDGCPKYEFFNVDGDDRSETLVIERTAMTQQAGRVWVIDNGKVVFKSETKAQIAVGPRNTNPDEQENGFIIFYATESPMAGEKVFKDSFKEDYYLFKDGKYILEKTAKSLFD